MKRKALLRNVFATMVVASVLFGCYKWKSYSQPTECLPSTAFQATLSIQPGDDPDNDYTNHDNADFGLFGVLLPNGWIVDEDEFEYTFTCSDPAESRSAWVYSNEVQAARLQELNPAPIGYYWWGGQTDDKVNMYGFVSIDMSVTIIPTDEEGDYNLVYAVGDLGDPTHPGKREPAYVKTPDMPIKITPDAALGKTTLEGVAVYPTKVNDFINIDVKSNASYKARIINMKGQTVKSQLLGNTHNTMDVSSLATGNYIVVVKSGEKVKYQKIAIM